MVALLESTGHKFCRGIGIQLRGGTEAIFPRTLTLLDGQECGVAQEVLRGSFGLLESMGVAVIVGAAPTRNGETALSMGRALRCFGSADRAVGAQIKFRGENLVISGVYRDFDWNLGRGHRSDFVSLISSKPLSFYGVAFGDVDPRRLTSVLLDQLKQAQPSVFALGTQDIDRVSAELYRQELAQARVLAGLGMLLALGAAFASSGLFAVVFAEVRGSLALRLALGASPTRLAMQTLLPLAVLGAGGMLLIGALRYAVGARSSVLSNLVTDDWQAFFIALLATLAIVLMLAGGRLLMALREPRLNEALYGT